MKARAAVLKGFRQPYELQDFLERTRARYPFERMLSHKFPLTKINDAFSQAEWLDRQKDVVITRASLVMD